jgi:hypothetical protein
MELCFDFPSKMEKSGEGNSFNRASMTGYAVN